MQKFFEANATTGFISEILRKTQLPQYKVVDDGDVVYKGTKYTYHGRVMICTQTGILGGGGDDDPIGILSVEKNQLTNDETGFVQTPDRNYGYANILKHGDAYYNTKIHEQLGEYLWYLKKSDIADLFSYYNCFSYHSVDNIYINQDSKYAQNQDKSYKTFVIPIKENASYSIFVDSPKIYVGCVLYDKHLIDRYTTEQISNALVPHINGIQSTFIDVYNVSFKNPIIFKTVPVQSGAGAEIKKLATTKLHIVIKIPQTNTSSVVILNGDYSNKSFAQQVVVGSGGDIDSYAESLNSKPSLTRINDGNIYAFSDRLLEYLTKNVIDKSDEIDNNIARVANIMQKNTRVKLSKSSYDNLTRILVYNEQMKSGLNKYDINGYVDKDTEVTIGLE